MEEKIGIKVFMKKQPMCATRNKETLRYYSKLKGNFGGVNTWIGCFGLIILLVLSIKIFSYTLPTFGLVFGKSIPGLVAGWFVSLCANTPIVLILGIFGYGAFGMIKEDQKIEAQLDQNKKYAERQIEQASWEGIEEIQQEFDKTLEVVLKTGCQSFRELMEKSISTIKRLNEKSKTIIALLSEENSTNLKKKIAAIVNASEEQKGLCKISPLDLLQKRLMKVEKMEEFVRQVDEQKVLLLESLKTLRFSLISATTDEEREKIFKDQLSLQTLDQINDIFE